MPKIQKLDDVTISKIAAGEVVDRPASIVKELIENSLDAGATKIWITLQDAGKKQIRIRDNGAGIHKEDLPLAPLQHTTSKITTLEDIYAGQSFGFRGEALASISHVAKVTITSKTNNAEAYILSAYENNISPISLATHQKGTTIDVSDLFYDVPVRRKFLKTDGTELSYINDIVQQMILIHPKTDFILHNNNKELLNSTGIADQETLALMIYGKSLKGQLIPVSTTIGAITYTGLISNPTFTVSNRNKQIIAVNHRLTKSPLMLKAFNNAYRDLIPHKRFPLGILNLSIDAIAIDVNIHPQKQDIKFLNPGFIFDTFPKMVQESLASQGIKETVYTSYPTQQPMSTSNTTEQTYAYPQQTHNPTQTEFTQSLNLFSTQTLNEIKTDHIEHLQILDTYIVVKHPEGLWILDQHAVHERILYEQIKENKNNCTDKQPLLISEAIQLSPDLFEIFLQEKTSLQALGFVTEDFGVNQIIIREIPHVFSDSNTKELILTLLDHFKYQPSHQNSQDGEKQILKLHQKEKLQMMACKAAIKAGKPLSKLEIEHLLKDLIASPSNYTCPHGRPLVIKLDKNKLEKMFLRI